LPSESLRDSPSATATRRKRLWRWEPAGYILLFLMLFVTSALQVTGPAVAFWIPLGLSVVVALIVVTEVFNSGARAHLR